MLVSPEGGLLLYLLAAQASLNIAEPFLATMGKPVEIAPGVFGTPSAADQAGAFLAKQAADLPAVRRALEGVVPDTVPGSTRTLGAATGDVGLLQNERNVVTGKPPVGSGNGADISNTTRYNVQVLGPQQAARTASLKSLADGGDAAAVGDHIRGVIADLDTRLQADVDAARTAGEASTKAANARGEAHVAAATDTGQRDVEAAQARSTADVGAAQDRAKQVAESLGGNGNPEDYGTTIRGHVADALKASDAREAGLWNAIDPDRKLTGNVSATKIAGRSIIDNMSPYDVPMNADESRIFAQVQELPPVAPLKDIVALRRSINDAASTELKTKGVPTASYARLSALRAALNDNLANTISDQVGRPGVAARVEAWENASGPQSAVRSGTGGAGQPTAGTGTPVVSATGGTALSAGSGSGSAAAAAGVSSEISPDLTPIRVGAQVVGYTAPDGTVMNAVQARAYRSAAPAPASTAASPPVTGQPTIDADALARMKAANAATAEQAQIYRQGPVEPTLRTYGFADQYQMAAGKVPAQFFKPGADGYEAMKALERASPEAMPAIHDYAASTLRDMAAKNDGIITPKILQAWESRYSDSLRALPDDMRVKFGLAAQAGQNVADRTAAADAAVKAAQETSKTDIANAKTLANEYTQAAADSANKTVSEAISRRKQTLHDAQAGAIGRVMGATSPDAVTKTVGSILEGPRGSDDMRALVNATRSNPDAAAGLKQAVIDHIVQKYMSNAEAGLTETNKLSANAFQTFLRKSEPALSQVLAPAEIGRLTAISRDMDESARAMSLTRMPGESNTYEKLARGGLSNGKNTRSLLDLLAASGGGIGAATHGAGLAAIPIGAAAGKLTDLIQGLRNRGIQNVADLVREGTFNANVGRALLARVKDPADTPKLGRALLKALIAPSVAATAAARPQSQQPSALQGVS